VHMLAFCQVNVLNEYDDDDDDDDDDAPPRSATLTWWWGRKISTIWRIGAY